MKIMTRGEIRAGMIRLGADSPEGIFTVDMFLEYHKKNPQIFKEFEKECFAQLQNGETLLRSKDIAERIRKNCGTKLQNSLISYYGRAFVVMYPEHKDKFKFNACTGVRSLAA